MSPHVTTTHPPDLTLAIAALGVWHRITGSARAVPAGSQAAALTGAHHG